MLQVDISLLYYRYLYCGIVCMHNTVFCIGIVNHLHIYCIIYMPSVIIIFTMVLLGYSILLLKWHRRVSVVT